MSGTGHERPRRVALVAANPAGARTGNERTTQRHRRLLESTGVDVRVARPTDEPDEVLRGVRPDIVHAYHARRSGPRAVVVAERAGAPLVVSVTGTDLGVDLRDKARREIVRSVLSRADAVVCGHEEEVGVVRALARDGVPVAVVPKSVEVAAAAGPVPEARGDGPLVLCVAHVRRVKRLDVAILALRRLHARGRRVRLALLGAVLEPDEEERLRRLVGAAPWEVVHRGAVPPAAVPGWLAAADVVLNTSDVEGGSNAVLEAMAAGRAVVASDIPANAAYVGRDGTRGVLYPVERVEGDGVVHNVAACADALAGLLDDPDRRARIGAVARDHVLREHTPQAELDALLALYAAARERSRES